MAVAETSANSGGPARNYTPEHLAEKILASRAAMEGEKKQVTVLFCDIAGSMDLAEAQGPEAWHETLNQFFAVLSAAVHEHEGTVNQYTGDGIMALFGAPLAAEDHARRACLAALRIQAGLASLQMRFQQELSLTLATRIGINSGEVVVGKIGDDLRMDYTAQGQVVGIAARLEALAEPGGVLISAHTHRQVAGYFELDSRGPQRIKGVSQPLEVFRLGRARQDKTRLDVARERGFSRFVGREAEMAILTQAFTRAHAGQGQVVGIKAPPGTGKSRLCWEFRQFCEAQTDVLIVPAAAQPHQRNLPYAYNNQIMRVIYGFSAGDTPEQRRAKIRARNLAWDPRAEQGLPLAYDFLGVPDPDQPPPSMAPELKRHWAIKAVAWAVRQLCREQTVVFILEDMQWADAASAEIGAVWAEQAAQGRVLFLWNARPEYQPLRPETQPHMHRILLQALDTDALREMLAASLGEDPSLAGLAERLIDTSGGNPFFVEEIIRGLIEEGQLSGPPGARTLARPVAGLPLPESVHSLLAARIDRLAERDKALLQGAAVIGREFDVATLAALSERDAEDLTSSLVRLQQAEFIHPSEQGWRFQHALTQDVAYTSLLQGRRQQLHGRIAQALAKKDGADGEQLARLAHHWEQAGELRQAALFTHKAAKAMITQDVKGALALWRELLRLEQAQPADPALAPAGIASRKALIEWSAIEPLRRDQAQALFDQGQRLAEKAGDVVRLNTLRLAYALRLHNEGRFNEAIALLQQVEPVVAAIDNPALKLGVDAIYRGGIYASAGRVGLALSATGNAQKLLADHPQLRQQRGIDMLAVARCWHGLALGLSGQLDHSHAMLRDCVESTSEHDLFGFFAVGWLGALAAHSGNSEAARASAEHIRSFLRRDAAGPWSVCVGHLWSGAISASVGEFGQARESLTVALTMSPDDDGLNNLRIGTRPWLALSEQALGQHAQARATLADNEAAVRQSGSLLYLATHCWLKCRILREQDGADASDALRESLGDMHAAFEAGDLELFRHLWCWETARLAALQGDAAGQREGLEQALASAEACGARGHAGEIRQELSGGDGREGPT